MLEDEADLAVGGVAAGHVLVWKKIGPLPGSGCSRPAMIRSKVVLPEPEGPNRATSSPLATVRLTSRRAVNSPNDLADSLDVDAHGRVLAFAAVCAGFELGAGQLPGDLPLHQ